MQFITLAFKIPAIRWQQADFPLILVTEVFFVKLWLWLTVRGIVPSPTAAGLLVCSSKVLLLLLSFIFRESYVHGMCVVPAASYLSA